MAVDLVIDIENTPGALAEVAAAISDAGVNIAAATCVGPADRAELHILATQSRVVFGASDMDALRAVLD